MHPAEMLFYICCDQLRFRSSDKTKLAEFADFTPKPCRHEILARVVFLQPRTREDQPIILIKVGDVNSPRACLIIAMSAVTGCVGFARSLK